MSFRTLRRTLIAIGALALLVLVSPGSVHAQCTCPATDDNGNGLVETGTFAELLACYYPAENCYYDPSDGMLDMFLGTGCPENASCPAPTPTPLPTATPEPTPTPTPEPTPTPTPSQVCGNGIVEGTETCDDGNTLDGDCCSSTCQLQDCSVGDVKDSFLRQGNKNTNEGANALLAIGHLGQNRVVVGFDLSGLDTSALTSAHLVLPIQRNLHGWGSSGTELAAYALLQDFAEGNGHLLRDHPRSRGNGSGVTFSCATDTAIQNKVADCAQTWDGGAFNAVPSDTSLVTNATTGTVEFDVTADVRAGQSEWLVKTEDAKRGGTVFFHSREGAAALADSTLAPRLELQYGSQHCLVPGLGC